MLKSHHPADFVITTLPGYTNLNYRLVNHQNDWILRIPRQQTNGFVNRSNEHFNRCQAARLGLTKNSLWNNDVGLTLTPTLAVAKTLIPEKLENESLLQHLASQIKKLHSSPGPFKGQLDIGETIERYFDYLDASQKQRLSVRMTKAKPLMAFFRKQKLVVPTHSDLNETNILIDNEQRIWFIDWEYSAMASPYWDLAIVCHYCRLNERQRQCFFKSYCGQDSGLVECELADFIELIALLTDCWMTALAD